MDQFLRYTRTVHLANKDSLSEIQHLQRDPNFSVLKIATQTVQEALEYMQCKDFYYAFNRASHWFVIAVEVTTDGSPSESNLVVLKSNFDNNKPIILQWKSPTADLIYFRNKCGNDFNHVDLRNLSACEDFITEGGFAFDKLLRALKVHPGGHLSDNLLTTTLDTDQEFDTWRLIDYAARDGDSLSLRYLMLADMDLTKRNSDQRRALEIAAEYANPDCLGALLNLPFLKANTEKWFLSDPAKELLGLENELGNTPLLIAAEKGNVDNVQLFILHGADIRQFNKSNKNSVTLAWENKHFNVVQQLLEADSPFPEEFRLEDSKDFDGLKQLTEARQNFHQALQEGVKAKDRVKSFIKDHPQLKQAYNPSNQSALITAFMARSFEMYSFLQSQGYALGIEEEQHPEGQLTEAEKNQLKNVKFAYFTKPEKSHITYLLSKSRLGLGQTGNHFDKIKNLYQSLDDIPEISTILQVVEQAKSFEIIFDFNHNSIIDLDPTQSTATAGACDYRRGRVYIGAKQEVQKNDDLLGTLAHELTHLAMQIRYHNDCNPYEALEEQKKSEFRNIVKEYESKEDVDEIIKRVFKVYKENDWPSELIVRVPHLLAKYRTERKEKLSQQASSLFDWYQKNIPADLNRFIKNPKVYEAAHQLHDLNQQLEHLGKLKKLAESIQLTKSRLLNNEVTDGQRMTLLSSSSSQLTLLNLYQRLVNLPGQLFSNLLVVQSSEFKNNLIARNIFDAMKSDSPPFLIIDCTQASNGEQDDVFSILKDIGQNKIILIVPDKSLAQKWQEFSPREETDNAYCWQDLTSSSQKSILEKTVNFQGYTIKLQQLMTADSPTAKILPLTDLLNSEKPLEIGKPLPISEGYDEDFYIGRTFNHKICIEESIFSDINDKPSELIAISQEEFTQSCKENPQKNVHWFRKESDLLIWQKSQGSLKNLRCYIGNQVISYPPKDIDLLLRNAQNNRVMLIADTAGMGKTTVLTHLSKEIKQANPGYFVIRIELNDHIDALEKLKGINFTVESVTEFLVQLLKLENRLEKELFTWSFHPDSFLKLVLLMDGFDEISPSYKESVVHLLKILISSAIENLWITTRPYQKEALEDELQNFSYVLEPLNEENQIDFLTRFWGKTLGESKNNPRLKDYAECLVRNLAVSIKDKERGFTGIPIQIRMLAEIFERKPEDSEIPDKIKNEIEIIEEGAKEFCRSQEEKPKIPKKMNLLSIYRHFVYKKYYDIYGKEKVRAKTVAAEDQLKELYPVFVKKHQELALYDLLGKERCIKLLTEKEVGDIETLMKDIKEGKVKTGIVDQIIGDKPHFVHRTFSEYFVADFLAKQFENKNTEFIDFFLGTILMNGDYKTIRNFIDILLKTNQPSKNFFKKCEKWIDRNWKKNIVTFKINILYYPVLENNRNIVNFLFNSLSGKMEGTLKELLTFENILQQKTVWILAAEKGYSEILQQIWEVYPSEQQKRDLLLSHGSTFNVWIVAVVMYKMETFNKLVQYSEEIGLNEEEFSNILLEEYDVGLSVWHLAAERGYEDIFKTLLTLTKKIKLNKKEYFKKLLLKRNELKSTVWNLAARNNNVGVFKQLCEWVKEVQLSLIDLKDILVLKDNESRTIWHNIADFNKDIVAKEKIGSIKDHSYTIKLLICEIFAESRNEFNQKMNLNKENNRLLFKRHFIDPYMRNLATSEDSKKILYELRKWVKELKLKPQNLLLDKDKDGQTAWHLIIKNNNNEMLDEFLDLVKEEEINIYEFFKELLLKKNKKEETIWHLAANQGDINIFEKVWKLTKEAQLSPEEFKKLLFDKDKGKQTVWHLIVKNSNNEMLDKFLILIKAEEMNKCDFFKELLLEKNGKGETIWHLVAKHGNIKIIENMWNLTKEAQLSPEEFKILLLGKDEGGQTLWHLIVKNRNNEMLDTFLALIKAEEINMYEFLKELLHEKNEEGETMWHLVVKHGNIKDIENMWKLTKEAQLSQEEFKKLLLDKNEGGQTLWHLAVEDSNNEILDKFLILIKAEEMNKCDFFKELLLEKNGKGETIWHLVAKHGSIKTIENIWKMTKEAQLSTENFKKLLLDKDRDKQTLWHLIVQNSNNEMLDKFLALIKAEELNMSEFFKLLLEKNKKRETVWHLVAKHGNKKIIENMWNLTKEAQLSPEEFKKLLFDKDKGKQTVWHLIVKNSNNEMLNKFLILIKAEEMNKCDFFKELLLEKNKKGETVWHLVAKHGNIKIMENMWNLTKEAQLSSDEVKKLLLNKDRNKETLWHFMIKYRNNEMFDKFLTLTKAEEMNMCEFFKELLLEKNKRGETMWHLIVKYDNIKVIEKMWNLTKEAQLSPEEFKKLLLDKDEDGQTLWHLIVEFNNNKMLDKFLALIKAEEINKREFFKELFISTNNDGRTILYLAMHKRNMNIVITILNHGADINDLSCIQCISLRKYIENKTGIENTEQLLKKIDQRLNGAR